MARTKRALNPNHGIGFYHVISRTVGGEFMFRDVEKEAIVRLMRKAEVFCGVQILTYAVMSNHYHILVSVPPREDLSEEETLARVKEQVGPDRYRALVAEIALLRKHGGEAAEKAVGERIAQIQERMFSLAGFMHTLNQSISEWYNKRHNRFGPLWAGRYKSVIVEGTGNALLTMAMYMDLNPVRAGIVGDPKDYRWTGYAQAVAGDKLARAGLIRLMKPECGRSTWAEIAPIYRRLIVVRGEKTEKRAGISREKVKAVLAAGGELSLAELLHCRIRYFSDGVAIGSRAFLDDVFTKSRNLFGKRRTSGPRPMQGKAAWGDLMTLRDLRRAPIT